MITDKKQNTMEKEIDKQVGGTHYSDMKMQPIEFISANNMNFIDGNMVKYASRHHAKNKDEDLKKVIHYAVLALKYDYGYSQEDVRKFLSETFMGVKSPSETIKFK